jgi:hypothetical protein
VIVIEDVNESPDLCPVLYLNLPLSVVIHYINPLKCLRVLANHPFNIIHAQILIDPISLNIAHLPHHVRVI